MPSMRSVNKLLMFSSIATEVPQCNSTQKDESKSDANCTPNAALKTNADDSGGLNSLPDDVLFQVLLYCGPCDVDEGIKFVSKRLHNASSLSLALWKEFCAMTGKSLDMNANSKYDSSSLSNCLLEKTGIEHMSREGDAVANAYRHFYFRNPCVPIDFETISEALKRCPRTPSRLIFNHGDDTNTFYSRVGTVVLMPGVYRDRIHIDGEPWAVGQSIKAVAIRASFPAIGAALMHYHCPLQDGSCEVDQTIETQQNQSCITISTRDADDLGGTTKGIAVRLSHLAILHATPGADIWGGNTAICVNGARCQVIIDSCVLQSDSGRGLVVTNQAELQMVRTNIIDCAATGVYLGDWGSRARISGCNIVRNGFGSKRLRSGEIDNIQNHFFDHARLGQPIRREQFDVVPSGHSGVYIESSMAWIENSLLAGNSLTGLSVVRSGFVNLSACDVTENGQTVSLNSDPIMIEDAHDVRDASRLQGISIRGGVVEGPIVNNYSSLASSDGMRQHYKGGVIRETPNFHCVKGPMTVQELLAAFEG